MNGFKGSSRFQEDFFIRKLHSTGDSLLKRKSHFGQIWLLYAQVGDFQIIRGPSTVSLKQILRNAILFKSQNRRNVGTPCKSELMYENKILIKIEILNLKVSKYPQ